MNATNPMTVPTLSKVVVNMGVGEGAEKLQKAEKVLASLTGQKPARTFGKKPVRAWNVRAGQPIGCKVTLRGEKAQKFVAEALSIRNNQVGDWSIDSQGNCSIGIGDHTDFSGQKYDPDVGIFGMDITLVIEKPGNRIKRRRILRAKVGKPQRVSRDEARAFLQETFKVEVVT